jgi:crotonobetainyl-CoA:carnitine CoA-transferase CaiB-like acyl-CoA transferase
LEQALKAARFSPYERNKRSIALDLKHPDGRTVLHKLLDNADVLVDGFRPGVMERLGFGYETLKARNTRLIYCAVSGFGQDGPQRDQAGHDLNYLAQSGALGLIGEVDGPPVMPLNLVADYAGGTMHALLGILLALNARHRTGEGQFVDVSYLDASFSLLSATHNAREFFRTGKYIPRGGGPVGGAYHYYGVYETADGKYLSVACAEPWLFANFCKALGLDHLSGLSASSAHRYRRPNEAEQQARKDIAAALLQKTRDEWLDFFRDKNVCVSALNSLPEAAGDAQILARNMVVEVHDERVGSIKQVGIPVKLSGTPGQLRAGGPVPGEHSEAILDELGYSLRDVEKLRSRRALAQAPSAGTFSE